LAEKFWTWRRGALGPEVLPIHRGNIHRLVDIKLRCGARGEHSVSHYLPFDDAEVSDFLAGRGFASGDMGGAGSQRLTMS